MTTLLHVATSPRGTRSDSLHIADAFLTAYCAAHPYTTVDTLNLWSETLPVFDGDKAAAKMAVMGGVTPTGAEGTAWQAVTNVADRFTAADRYLFSVPMWNGGVP